MSLREEILKEHVVGGKVFKKAAAKDDYYEQIKKQTRIALEFGGVIDPEDAVDAAFLAQFVVIEGV